MKELEKFVTVRQVEGFTMIPTELQSEIVKKIGSKMDASTKNVLIGLDLKERQYILPTIITNNETNVNFDWATKVKYFYADLTINVPRNKGLRLNIATEKQMFKFIGDEEESEIDFPVSPMDYLMYKQCVADEDVATTEHELRNEKMFSFKVVDENIEKDKLREAQVSKDKLDEIYLKLTTKDGNTDKFKNIISMDAVLRMLGSNPQHLSNEDKVFELSKMRDIAKTELKDEPNLEKSTFYKVITDKDLKLKSKIMTYVELGILTMEGSYFADAENNSKIIGETMAQAVAYFHNPVNTEQVNKYRLKHQGQSEVVETV